MKDANCPRTADVDETRNKWESSNILHKNYSWKIIIVWIHNGMNYQGFPQRQMLDWDFSNMKKSEDGGGAFHRNVGNSPRDYTVS
jgi:hypothetical protein